ncbi:MAG: DUF2752 domain-containing protein [Polyangiales bacterium]
MTAALRPDASGSARAFWATVLAAALAVLALSRFLQPDPSGFGTHTQLGLPPCAFRAITSLPCPTCGLTTAFAYMARLQITSAVRSHPLGLPLFALDVTAVPLSLLGFARAWPINHALRRLRVGSVAVIISVAALLAWVARLIVILRA